MFRIAITKINSVLANLREQALNVDKQNAGRKSHAVLKEKALFFEGLFSKENDNFADYVDEVQQRVIELERLLTSGKSQLSHQRLLQVEQQIKAIINAMNANNAMHEKAQLDLNANKARNFKRAAKKLMQPTQSLYQSLAEHHEFERRLMQMLNDKQLAHQNTKGKAAESLADQVLVLHQRLGRCRQAISKIERQIELIEKR